MEEWRDIPGYEGLYQVSNEGRVRSLDRFAEIKNQYGKCLAHYKGKLLAPKNDGTNHFKVTLSKNGVYEHPRVYVLVAKTFIPNPNNYDVVHHIDHNPQNNRIENLIWMENGKHTGNHNIERCSKTVYQYTIDGELVAVWESASEAAKQLGFQKSAISRCCNGGFFDKNRNKWHKAQTYKGFRWSYVPL